MCQKFDVELCNQTVGVASVIKEGLYYNIKCRCQFSRPGIYKLRIYGVNGFKNLGTFLPEGACYTLEKRIPTKTVGDGIRAFRIYPSREGTAINGFPVDDDRPFEKIADLRRSRLLKTDGKVLIQILGERDSDRD